jgi:Cyclic nucleotide-binding domain
MVIEASSPSVRGAKFGAPRRYLAWPRNPQRLTRLSSVASAFMWSRGPAQRLIGAGMRSTIPHAPGRTTSPGPFSWEAFIGLQRRPWLVVAGYLAGATRSKGEAIKELDAAEKSALIAQVDFFKRCTQRQIDDVAKLLVDRHFAIGDELCRQGDVETQGFVLVDGEAAVLVDGEHVATASAGDVVGELSMLGTGRRTATLRALTPVHTPDRARRDRLGAFGRPEFESAARTPRTRRLRTGLHGIPTQFTVTTRSVAGLHGARQGPHNLNSGFGRLRSHAEPWLVSVAWQPSQPKFTPHPGTALMRHSALGRPGDETGVIPDCSCGSDA